MVAGDAESADRRLPRRAVVAARPAGAAATGWTPSGSRPTRTGTSSSTGPRSRRPSTRSRPPLADAGVPGWASTQLCFDPARHPRGGCSDGASRRADAARPAGPGRAGRADEADRPRHAGGRRPVAAVPQEERPGARRIAARRRVRPRSAARRPGRRPGAARGHRDPPVHVQPARGSRGLAPVPRGLPTAPGGVVREPARRHLLAGHPGPGQRPGRPASPSGHPRASASSRPSTAPAMVAGKKTASEYVAEWRRREHAVRRRPRRPPPRRRPTGSSRTTRPSA